MRIHPLVSEAARVFAEGGFSVHLVGGSVRDAFLGKEAADFDIASSASCDEVFTMFRAVKGAKVFPTGVQHGTVTLIYKGLPIECTTYRREADYTDGRRPGSVEMASSIEEDLSRRDFTMNAIAVELPEGRRIVDPFCGRRDIRKRLVRCVGEAAARFAEDGLRPLRALRFSSTLGFDIDAELMDAIPASLETVAKVSGERKRDEFDKIVMSSNPLKALRYMEETGLLSLIIAELAACRAVTQAGRHKFDVLDHSLYALEYAASRGEPLAVRLAALFHDIGKPQSRFEVEDGNGNTTYAFHRHEVVSAKLTEDIMRRLKYPNAVIDETVHLVLHHMFNYSDAWNDGAVRRFLSRVGSGSVDALIAVRMCDAYGMTREIDALPFQKMAELKSRIDRVLTEREAFSLKDLSVNGNDLVALGIPAGRRLGVILQELLETVIDDPAQNTRETLLRIARNMAE